MGEANVVKIAKETLVRSSKVAQTGVMANTPRQRVRRADLAIPHNDTTCQAGRHSPAFNMSDAALVILHPKALRHRLRLCLHDGRLSAGSCPLLSFYPDKRIDWLTHVRHAPRGLHTGTIVWQNAPRRGTRRVCPSGPGGDARAARPRVASAEHWRRGAPIRFTEDGRWQIEPGHSALISARKAVRQRLELVRRQAALRPDPAAIEAAERQWDQVRAARGLEFAGLRRVLVCAFPPGSPEAVVLVDIGQRTLETFFSDGLDEVRRRLASCDLVAAVNVRAVLAALGVAPGTLRLTELGPPQKSKTLNKQGRTLKITTAMLILGSCRIARPLGDEAKMREYLRNDQATQLRRRLESDAKALLAMYEYGRLHGCLRLRWGFLDEPIPVPWVHRDEPNLYDLKRAAAEQGAIIEVVTGSAPGWEHPWSRARRCRVAPAPYGHGLDIIDESGLVVDQREIQIARLVTR